MPYCGHFLLKINTYTILVKNVHQALHKQPVMLYDFRSVAIHKTFLALNSISLRSTRFNSISFHFRLACAYAKGFSLVTALANPNTQANSATAAPRLCEAFCEAALQLSLHRPFAQLATASQVGINLIL